MKYAMQNYDDAKMARAMGVSLPISFKQSIEMCNLVKGMQVAKARSRLNAILQHKQALPMKRFNADRGHKPGMGPGQYPEKTTKQFLALLQDVEANAVQKGLAADALKIIHAIAHKGQQQFHFGRQRRRRMKRTHVEMVVEESSKSVKKPAKQETKVPVQKQATPVKKENVTKPLQKEIAKQPVQEKVAKPASKEEKK